MATLDAPSGEQIQESVEHPVPWRVREAVAVFLISFSVGIVAVVILLAVAPAPVARGLQFPVSLAPLAVVSWLWVRLRHPGRGRLLLGRRPPTRRDVVTGAGFGVAAFLVINVALTAALAAAAQATGVELPEVQQELREAARDPGTMPYLIVAAVIVAPIAEELFFRGMLFQALRRRMRLWGAAALSAVTFAAAHAQATPLASALVFASIFPLGIFLAWVVERRGSLLIAVTVHAVFNLLGVVGMLAGLG